MRSLYFSLVLLFLCSTVTAEKSVANRQVVLSDRIIHGLALYESSQGRQFSAISTLLRGINVRSSQDKQLKSRQLLAELYTHYGLLPQATQIFNSIINNSSTASVQNRAWYGLAQLRYRRGYVSEAALALNNIKSDFPYSNSSEYQEMQTNVYLSKKSFDKAKKLLKNNSEQFWQRYAQLKLAKILIDDNKPAQAIISLMALTEIETESNEYLALRDEANLTLAYILLKQGKAGQAITVFNKISLSGVSANRALLGLGLAWQHQNKSEKVLSTWTELATRNFTDPAVQQAWYLMPVYLEKINKPELAAIQYQQSNNRIDNQLATVEEIIGIVAQGEFLRALKPDDSAKEHSLDWLGDILPESISSLYLYRLMASNKFQDAVSLYQDILFLQFIVTGNNLTIARLDNNLVSQIKLFPKKFEKITSGLSGVKKKLYINKRDNFIFNLKKIEKSNSIYSLATARESVLNEQLASIGRRLDRIADSEPLNNLVSRYQRINGILHWQLASNFKQRLLKANVSIQALTSALISNTKARKYLQTLDTLPASFPKLLKSVKAKSKRIIKLKIRVNTLLEQQGRYIESLALNELKRQRSRLQSYQTRIRFAQARLFDQLAQAAESQP